MFDNLPFRTYHEPTILSFACNERLDFKSDTYEYYPDGHERGGEMKFRRSKFKYYNLTIIIKYDAHNNPIELTSSGSFHYLKNFGIHNADNFDLNKARNILTGFANIFEIELYRLELRPPEFAVMIIPDSDNVDIIRNTICERRKMFSKNSPGNPSKISGTFANDFRLKIYSKYYEFPNHCPPNTSRIELQAKKMRPFLKKGIRTMADLLKLETWHYIRDLHLKYFDQVIIFDDKITIPKNSKFKKELVNLKNPNYWEKLIEDCKNNVTYRTKYNEKVDLLRKLSKRYGCNLHENLMQLTEKQWVRFFAVCGNTYFKISRFPTEAPLLKPTEAPFIACFAHESITQVAPISK